MKFTTILGKPDFLENLRGKETTFLLALSNTKTYEIEGISQAGIPGKIYLTPTLDSEFVCTGEVRSLEGVPETPKGVPTPALITRAVHLLKPYKNLELLNLGLEKKPQVDYFVQHEFGINPSLAINEGAQIDAMELFQKGVEFGQNYELKSDYIILAESVPAGTTTAYATAKALGYDVDGKFSSSYKNSPNSVKEQTVNAALENLREEMELFEKLGNVADNMLIFNAGFVLGLSSKQTKVVLAGGTQMAGVLLVINSIIDVMGGMFDSKNVALCTTKWVYEDENSDLKALLEMLSFPINAYASDFDFSLSVHPALKLYDEGEAKEGVGAGAALCYASLNGLDKQTLTDSIEAFLA